MLIHHLTLSDENLPGQRLFYTPTTGFYPPICSDNAFTANTSTAGLTFNQQGTRKNLAYHFAYTLPEKQLSVTQTGHTNAADIRMDKWGQTLHEKRQMAGTDVKGFELANGFQLSVQVASAQAPNQGSASFSRSYNASKTGLLRPEKGTYCCIGFIQEIVEIRQ